MESVIKKKADSILAKAWIVLELIYGLSAINHIVKNPMTITTMLFSFLGILLPIVLIVNKDRIKMFNLCFVICNILQTIVVYAMIGTPVVCMSIIAISLLCLVYENSKFSIISGIFVVISCETIITLSWTITKSINLFNCIIMSLIVLTFMLLEYAMTKMNMFTGAYRMNIVNEQKDKVEKAMNESKIQLEENINNISEIEQSMSDISDAMVGFADSIQVQNEAIQLIQTELQGIERQSEKLNDTYKTCDSAVIKGTISSKDTMSQSNDVKTSVDTIKNSVNELLDDVNQIKEMVELINKLSSDSHLLGLNAQIEASHAGESGKGFAVVASNIQKMAKETSESTKRIENIIEKLSSASMLVKENVSMIDEKVSSQIESVKDTDDSFKQITEAINNLNPIILDVKDRIIKANDLNNSFVSEINSLSATSQELTASSENITSLTEDSVNKLNNVLDIVKNV